MQPEPSPEAGGPQGETGPIIVPKKGEEQPPKQEPKPPKVKNPPGLEDYSIRVTSQLVTVPVTVVTKDGQFIPNLKAENFRVLEDGTEQKVSKLEQTEAPITVVMLLEFSNPNFFINKQIYGTFMYDMFQSAYGFAQSLKKEDWVAVVAFDMKPRMVVDFTQNKREVLAGLNSLQVPMFSESNLFDSLYDTIDRLEGVEGHKYIVLIGSGIDTFSKINLDKTFNKIKSTRDTTIYTISTGYAAREYFDVRGGLGRDRMEQATTRLTYLQADNQMRTFAELTGGMHFQPRFSGEIPGIMQEIAQTVRNQYMLYYRPTNSAQDGSYRKLKVEVKAPTGGPLTVQDEKGKKLKYQVIYREGYRARQIVE
jgi:VWFA-related protein